MGAFDPALDRLDYWPVPHAGAAVVSAAGVIEMAGETTTILPIASVSKLLTTYAVLIGVEEGAVQLDDAAGPEGATLRHLLAHAAGYSFDDRLGVLAEPGTRRIYSNTGIEAAAEHLAKESGIPFAEYLREAVLDPLEMYDTDISGSPAHGFTSTVADLSVFALEILAPRLLAPQSLDEAYSVQFPGLAGVVPGVGRFDPCDWGLGFERNLGREDHWAGTAVSPAAGGHFGSTGSFLIADRGHGFACVCLTGRDFDTWALQAWPPFIDAVVAQYLQPVRPDSLAQWP